MARVAAKSGSRAALNAAAALLTIPGWPLRGPKGYGLRRSASHQGIPWAKKGHGTRHADRAGCARLSFSWIHSAVRYGTKSLSVSYGRTSRARNHDKNFGIVAGIVHKKQ